MRRLTIRMTTEMHEELRKLSYQEYRPVNKIIIEALAQYLKDLEEKDANTPTGIQEHH